MWKKIIGIGILLLLIGGGTAYYYLQYDYRDDIVGKKADFRVTASTLYADYAENESAANKKYLGKVIAVNGKIGDIGNEGAGISISLITQDPMGQVVCEMNQSIPFDWSSLEVNQDITIKGECSGKLMDVIVVNGVVENEG